MQSLSLHRSKRKLWMLSPEMQDMLSMRSWFRHLKRHHRHYVKFKKKVDVSALSVTSMTSSKSQKLCELWMLPRMVFAMNLRSFLKSCINSGTPRSRQTKPIQPACRSAFFLSPHFREHCLCHPCEREHVLFYLTCEFRNTACHDIFLVSKDGRCSLQYVDQGCCT